jgi:DNA-binding IclR family transcriptional regulator
VTGTVQAVERSVDVLHALRAGPRTLTEVARETGLTKATTFRLLASLAHRSVVIKDPTSNRYQAGPGLLKVAEGAASEWAWAADLLRPSLTELRDGTEETVALHVRIGLDRICIEEIPSRQAIRYSAEVGLQVPLSVGSAGKVLLAAEPAKDRERILARLRLARLTDRTITDAEHLQKVVEAVSLQGWAESAGERVIGAAAVSVAIRGPSLLLALSVLAPEFRLGPGRRAELGRELLELRPKLERRLASAPMAAFHERA